MTTRAELESSLSLQDADALELILKAAGVSTRGRTTSAGLASRIVDAIWWTYATPLGYVADRADFEDIVWHVARRLRVDDRIDRSLGAHDQVQQLTEALLGQIDRHGVRVEDLDADTQRRLGASWLPTFALGTSAGGSFATRWASGRVVDLLKTPVGRLLPLLPAVGPYVGAIKGAAVAVHTVAGPLGVALSVLTFNQALGANYRKLVPLVLGVGALRPDAVEDAEELDPDADTAERPFVAPDAHASVADGDDVDDGSAASIEAPPLADAAEASDVDRRDDDVENERSHEEPAAALASPAEEAPLTIDGAEHDAAADGGEAEEPDEA